MVSDYEDGGYSSANQMRAGTYPPKKKTAKTNRVLSNKLPMTPHAVFTDDEGNLRFVRGEKMDPVPKNKVASNTQLNPEKRTIELAN
jgi:hypothetical protein